MANYLIRSCDELTSLVVNPGENTLTIDNIYYVNFTGETNPNCFIVDSESEDPINEGVSAVTQYNSCLECLESEGFTATLSACSSDFVYGQTLTQFPKLPTVGEYYKFCDPEGSEVCFCFVFLGYANNETVFPAIYGGGPFTDCDCDSNVPRSANTETLICQEVCDNEGGKTVTEVTPPYPEWTDNYGTPVTQLNMVTLGGMKGLNS